MKITVEKKYPILRYLRIIVASLLSAVALTINFDNIPGQYNIVPVIITAAFIVFYLYIESKKFETTKWLLEHRFLCWLERVIFCMTHLLWCLVPNFDCYFLSCA